MLAAGFVASGAVHLLKPELYLSMMPRFVPAHREVVLGSGIAEIVLAAGLMMPRTRRLAGWGSLGLVIGVYPANLKMAQDALAGSSTTMKVGALARLPLQWPMARAAHAVARG